MSPLELLTARYNEKRAAIQTLTDSCVVNGVTRDFTPDENSQFATLLAESKALKASIADATDVESAPVVAEGPDRRSLPIQAPAVHTDRTKKPYSYLAAIRSKINYGRLEGLEAEVEQEIIKRTNKQPRPGGFLVPTGADANVREMLRYGTPERRDLTTTNGGAGGLFKPAQLPLIDILRNKLVLRQAGARFVPDLHGQFSVPRQTGTSQTYMLAEGVPASISNPSYDQVHFTPRVAITAVSISAQYLAQSSLDVEQEVKDDIAGEVAVYIDTMGLNGQGGAQPTGLLQRGDVPVYADPANPNGGFASWQSVVDLESMVSSANADRGKLAYITNAKVRGALKTTSKGNGYPTFVWEDGAAPGIGEVNGYPAYTTGIIPINLSKGTSGQVLSAIAFGNFDDMVIGMWEGISMMVNPYSGQLSGTIILSNETIFDVELRRPQSFAIATDVQYQ